MITLGNGYSIKTDSTGCTLHFEETRQKDNKEKTEKVDYLFKDDWYFLSVKQCLERYLQLELEECENVKTILEKIESVHTTIKSLK